MTINTKFFDEVKQHRWYMIHSQMAQHHKLQYSHIMDMLQYYNTIPMVQQMHKHDRVDSFSNVGRYFAGLDDFLLKLDKEAPEEHKSQRK